MVLHVSGIGAQGLTGEGGYSLRLHEIAYGDICVHTLCAFLVSRFLRVMVISVMLGLLFLEPHKAHWPGPPVGVAARLVFFVFVPAFLLATHPLVLHIVAR